MATTTAKMINTPIALNPDHLSSSTAATTMVTTRMMLGAAHVSSISFCRRRAATTRYVSLKAWSSSRCSSWRTITKSGSCQIHQRTMDADSQNDQKGSHLECCERAPMMEKMYQLFQTEKKLYKNLLKSAHHWQRYETLKKIYHYYKKAVYKSRHPNKHLIVTSNSAVASALVSMIDKYYKIPMYIQKTIRAPFDYYEFGRKYFRPLIDFKNSYVGNIFIFQEIEEKIRKGENVILFSNHQHVADHVISGLLLESTHPFIYENVTYLGEEVFSDSFYNIFNMGRNIINSCYRHVSLQRDAHVQVLEDQTRQLLRRGSQIIWHSACQGSKHPVTQEYIPTIDINSKVIWVINLACESNVPFHTYPIGLLCLPPPPFQFLKSRRRHEPDQYEQVISFQGVGLSIGHEMLNFKQHVYNITTKEKPKSSFQLRRLYIDTVLDSVMNQYNVLRSAIHEKQGLGASNHAVLLSQPFDFLT